MTSTHMSTRVPDLGTHVPDLGTHVPVPSTHVPDVSTHVPDLGTHVPDPGAHVPDLGTHVPTEDSTDVFMMRFKQLKRRRPPADLSGVIDFDCPAHVDSKARIRTPSVSTVTSNKITTSDKLTDPTVTGDTTPCSTTTGLIPVTDWRIYELRSVPGAIIIRNPFTCDMRRYIISRCLSDYPLPPNITNLDSSADSDGVGVGGSGGGGRVYNDVWSAAHLTNQSEQDSVRAQKELKKLRWTTLGYHYDWTKKIYDREKIGEFPPDLSHISQYIIHAVLGEETRFTSEAAIVNYYHIDSSLSGHTDHSEFDLTAPLISISFGLPCVFMIGGQTKSQEPEALYLRDGDVMIMSGSARMSYHAVPKVLPAIPQSTPSHAVTKISPAATPTKQQEQCGEVIPAANTPQTKPIKHTLHHPTHTEDSHTNNHEADTSINNHASGASESHRLISEAVSSIGVTTNNKRTQCEDRNMTQRHNKRSKSTSEYDNCVYKTELLHRVTESEFWEPYEKYLQTLRININIRQMFEPGKGPEDYVWPTIDPHSNIQR